MPSSSPSTALNSLVSCSEGRLSRSSVGAMVILTLSTQALLSGEVLGIRTGGSIFTFTSRAMGGIRDRKKLARSSLFG